MMEFKDVWHNSDGLLESVIERWLRKEVKAIGGMFMKLTPVLGGEPDRICIVPGVPIHFVELKRATGELRDDQKKMISKMEAAGALVCITYGKMGAQKYLDFLNKWREDEVRT